MFGVHAPFDAKGPLIDEYKKQVDLRGPTYAAMIESMDDAVGALLDTLDRLGIADNTIIVFASDNGGNMCNEVDDTTTTSNTPLRGGKATMYEGGVRGPAIVVQPGGTCQLSLANGVLLVNSIGTDPHLNYHLPQAVEAKTLPLTPAPLAQQTSQR